MMRSMARKVLLLGLITAAGCISTSSGERVRLAVPFIPQAATNQCGVSCLAMALDYYGIPYVYQDLVKDVYIPALYGSTPELIADTAEVYGLRADIRRLAVADIAPALARHQIPILFLPPAAGERIGHYILVHGTTASPSTFRTHDGISMNRLRKLTLDAYPAVVLDIDKPLLSEKTPYEKKP